MRWIRAVSLLVAAVAVRPGALLWAQADTASPSPRKAPRGGQFLLPLGSLLLLPGLGQYVQRAPLTGVAFTSGALAGFAVMLSGDTAALYAGNIPRDPDGQRAFLGAELYVGSAMLSAYDSFHRSVAWLQEEEKYDFLTSHESTASLLTAPFDFRFVRRWTTLADLAYTAAVTALVVSRGTSPSGTSASFDPQDGLFVVGLSYGAGVGEEALFRGWLYPLLHENLGRQFWVSNTLQASGFGALHGPQAGWFALAIGGWAFYEGWVTRRNGWSIRESIFHHFWYDVAVATATLLTDEDQYVAITFPPISF